MGLLLSYFRRPKDAVAELEGIESQLSRLETRRQRQLNLQKRFLGYLLITFVLGYPTALAVYYVYWMPSSWLAQAAHVAAFVAALPLFYCLRRCLIWLFVRSLANCEAGVRQLREDKQRVLDRVMDTETYKRAKEILDRFDPDRFRAEFQQQQQPQVVKPGEFFARSPISKRQPAIPQPASRTTPPQRHQHPAASAGAAASVGSGGVVLRQLSVVSSSQQPPQPPPPLSHLSSPPQQQPQLPRPVLSRNPSLMDRVLDLLVGDGADRRYALICRRCCGHNGMALAEEFPYLAWRCAYCTYMHAPRQQRPMVPSLMPMQQYNQLPTPNPMGERPLDPLPNHSPSPPHRRPQWQSLIDLRPPPVLVTVGGGGTQSLRSSSSSSAASTPSPSPPLQQKDQLQQQTFEKANGQPDADSEHLALAAGVRSRRPQLSTEPSQ